MEEERNRVLKTAQNHIVQKSAQAVDPTNQHSTVHQKSVGELRLMAELMEDIQHNLEPLRDRALDEKARLTGYSQCAETMIKIIADRATTYKVQAVEMARQLKMTTPAVTCDAIPDDDSEEKQISEEEEDQNIQEEPVSPSFIDGCECNPRRR